MERRPGQPSSGMSHGRESKHLAAVVVGVDGSAGSGEALQWAIAEARLREVPLRAIHTWTYAQPLIPSLIGYPLQRRVRRLHQRRAPAGGRAAA